MGKGENYTMNRDIVWFFGGKPCVYSDVVVGA